MSRKRRMLTEMKEAFIRKFVFVLILMQLGFGCAIYGLVLLSQFEPVYGTTVWYAIVASLVLLYGGFLLGLYFIFAPLYRLYRKYQALMQWRHWLLSELPKIVEIIMLLFRQIRKAFHHEKDHHHSSHPSSNSSSGQSETDRRSQGQD